MSAVNGSCLTQLTIKPNIPNNMFLNEIGRNYPNLQELDIGGAEVVTDFGMVCLLYADPEQIFLKCWNRERTVGQQKRSMRAFHIHTLTSRFLTNRSRSPGELRMQMGKPFKWIFDFNYIISSIKFLSINIKIRY